jgi:hypothetical protein
LNVVENKAGHLSPQRRCPVNPSYLVAKWRLE